MDAPERSVFMATERLGFGTWAEDDDAIAMSIWGEPSVTALIGGPFALRQVRDRLLAEIANHHRHGFQYWPIFRRDTGRPVGCCGLRPRDIAAGVLELGFHLRRDAWSRGYARESARAVIAWARDERICALIAGHHPGNHASRHTLRRLGFVYTHDEYYAPTEAMEPCYRLALDGGTIAPA